MLTPASGSFRFHTARLNTHNIPLYTGLMLVLGHGADAPVTRWDEMFLPLKLREYLRDVRVPDSAGAMVPLVREERVLFESRSFPVPDAPPSWGVWYLIAGSLLGAGLWWSGGAGHRSVPARRALLIAGTGWAALTGIAGAILVGLWGLTDHLIASRNENVLQCSLFALALALVLPFARRERPGVLRTAWLLAVAVGGLSVLGLLLKALPAFDQVNAQILAFLVPANLGLAAGVIRWSAAEPG
jgi:hypothetical protein